MTTDDYRGLAKPPTEGFDPVSCEYLAYENARIAAAVTYRADTLDLAGNGATALAIVELRTLAEQIQASAQRYLAAQQAAAPARRPPSPHPR